MAGSARHNFDTLDYIHLWDYTPAESYDRIMISGSVGPLLDSILKFISRIGHENINVMTSSLSRSVSLVPTTLGRFKIWTKSFDSDECDLVTVVDYSPQLKETVALLLSGFAGVLVGLFGHLCDSDTLLELNSALSQLLPASSSPTTSDLEEPDDSEDQEHLEDDLKWDEDSEIQQLKCLVDALFQLLPALEEILEEIATRKERTQTLLRTLNVEETYSDIISAKYPRAPAFLPKRLAQGVIGAWNRLGLFRDEEDKTLVPVVPAPSVAGSVFSDLSDLLTVMSPNLHRQNRLALPSMPEPGVACPICFDKQTFISNSHWRKHAFSDLMPYMCIHADCPNVENQKSFKTWREWMKHDQSVHSVPSGESGSTGGLRILDTSTPACPFGCRVVRHSSGDGWYRHVGHHMEDIRLLALPPSLRQPCGGFEENLSSTSSPDTGDPEGHNARGLPMIKEGLFSDAGSDPAADRNSISSFSSSSFASHSDDEGYSDSEGPPINSSDEEDQNSGTDTEELAVQTMKTNLPTIGQEYPETVASMINLAEIFYTQGRWKEEEELLVQIIEARKKILGQEHLDTLTSMSNLALTYTNQGRSKEAEELNVQVMEATKRVLGQEHPETLTSMGNLALLYTNQGRTMEAEVLEVQILEARKRMLSQEHPHTLISMNNLASIYWSQGRFEEAEELEVQVLEVKKRVCGRRHPDTLLSMHNLADTYKSRGAINEAITLMGKAATLRSRILGDEHPDTKSSMTYLAKWRNEVEKQSRLSFSNRYTSPSTKPSNPTTS